MTDAYFLPEPGGYAPAAHASGPWSPDMLHGRLLGGLAARALEADLGRPGWRAARLTVDLFRPAAMEPVQVTTRPVRDGRRIRVADASLTVAGHEVARASAVFLAEGADPPGQIWQPPAWDAPDPETLPPAPLPDGMAEPAWKFRIAEGGFETSQRARVWTWETAPLVAGEPLSPLVRAALSADAASPLANSSDDGLHYINSDYTLVLARYPADVWIGLESAQQLAADGIALASCTLYDRSGPFATSTTSALANPPLRH